MTLPNLRDCAERTLSSSDRSEWHGRLTGPQKALEEAIAKLIANGPGACLYPLPEDAS